MKKLKNKFILDACCSVRAMWDKYNKHHPNAVYIDIRKEPKGFIKEKPNYEVNPDFVMDYRKMDFPDKSFKLVLFDPPHLKNSGRSIFKKQYGDSLVEGQWQIDLKKGFDECWRVLDDYGTLLLKWSDHDIKVEQVLSVVEKRPIIRNIQSGTGKTKTYWFVFMKIPKNPS